MAGDLTRAIEPSGHVECGDRGTGGDWTDACERRQSLGRGVCLDERLKLIIGAPSSSLRIAMTAHRGVSVVVIATGISTVLRRSRRGAHLAVSDRTGEMGPVEWPAHEDSPPSLGAAVWTSATASARPLTS